MNKPTTSTPRVKKTHKKAEKLGRKRWEISVTDEERAKVKALLLELRK